MAETGLQKTPGGEIPPGGACAAHDDGNQPDTLALGCGDNIVTGRYRPPRLEPVDARNVPQQRRP